MRLHTWDSGHVARIRDMFLLTFSLTKIPGRHPSGSLQTGPNNWNKNVPGANNPGSSKIKHKHEVPCYRTIAPQCAVRSDRSFEPFHQFPLKPRFLILFVAANRDVLIKNQNNQVPARFSRNFQDCPRCLNAENKHGSPRNWDRIRGTVLVCRI